jgi:hypothetical protein
LAFVVATLVKPAGISDCYFQIQFVVVWREVLMTQILVPASYLTAKKRTKLERLMVVEEKDWSMLRKLKGGGREWTAHTQCLHLHLLPLLLHLALLL